MPQGVFWFKETSLRSFSTKVTPRHFPLVHHECSTRKTMYMTNIEILVQTGQDKACTAQPTYYPAMLVAKRPLPGVSTASVEHEGTLLSKTNVRVRGEPGGHSRTAGQSVSNKWPEAFVRKLLPTPPAQKCRDGASASRTVTWAVKQQGKNSGPIRSR